MVETTEMLLEKYSKYSSPYNKISRLVDENKLFPIVRGLYETDCDVPPYSLAIHILAPSYVSFETALAYYSMIPEQVVVTFSATTNMHKTKQYKSECFGMFVFQDVPSSVFSLGIRLIKESENWFWIASKEKALCDKLYKMPPIYNTVKSMEWCLYEDLRLDEDDIKTFSYDSVSDWANKYHSTNVSCFSNYLKRIKR